MINESLKDFFNTEKNNIEIKNTHFANSEKPITEKKQTTNENRTYDFVVPYLYEDNENYHRKMQRIESYKETDPLLFSKIVNWG